MNLIFNCESNKFQKQLKEETYIDKSLLIKQTNSAIDDFRKLLCVSAPKGFGKTFNADMLAAYYTGGENTEKLFSKLKISKDSSFKKHLNKYNLLYINPAQFQSLATENKSITYLLKSQAIQEMKSAFPDINEVSNLLSRYILKIYEATKRKFVIIIDDYDFIFHALPVNNSAQIEYIDFLTSIFKGGYTLKALALVYMTGMMPIVRTSSQSSLNNFYETSMVYCSNFYNYFGFRENEVKFLCNKYKMDYGEMNKWYGGYSLKNNNVFHSSSVIKAVNTKQFKDFGGTFPFLSKISSFIDSNLEGIKSDLIKLLSSQKLEVITTNFNNKIDGIKCKDDLLTLLIHLGYLSAQRDQYDPSISHIRIPNLERMEELKKIIKHS